MGMSGGGKGGGGAMPNPQYSGGMGMGQMSNGMASNGQAQSLMGGLTAGGAMQQPLDDMVQRIPSMQAQQDSMQNSLAGGQYQGAQMGQDQMQANGPQFYRASANQGLIMGLGAPQAGNGKGGGKGGAAQPPSPVGAGANPQGWHPIQTGGVASTANAGPFSSGPAALGQSGGNPFTNPTGVMSNGLQQTAPQPGGNNPFTNPTGPIGGGGLASQQKAAVQQPGTSFWDNSHGPVDVNSLNDADRMYLNSMKNVPGMDTFMGQQLFNGTGDQIKQAVNGINYSDPAAVQRYDPRTYNGPLKAQFDQYFRSNPQQVANMERMGYANPLTGQYGTAGLSPLFQRYFANNPQAAAQYARFGGAMKPPGT